VDNVEASLGLLNHLKTKPKGNIFEEIARGWRIETAYRNLAQHSAALVESFEWRVVRSPELVGRNTDWYSDLMRVRLDGEVALDSIHLNYLWHLY
jgi:hypothetical protein